jgi:hypothetical protein
MDPLKTEEYDETNTFSIGDDVFLFYDLFVAPSRDCVIGVGPFYPKNAERQGIDYDRIDCRLSLGAQELVSKGQRVPDKHEHTLIMKFPIDPMALAACQTLSVRIGAGPHAKDYVLRVPSARPHYFTMATLIRDENPWLGDWLTFHSLLGTDHFYVYDNGTKEQGALFAILAPYQRMGKLTYVRWDFPYWDEGRKNLLAQPQQQNHAIYKYGTCNWMGLIDVDEYLYPQRKQSLLPVLKKYDRRWSRSGGLAVRSMWFGCSGVPIEDLRAKSFPEPVELKFVLRKQREEPKESRQKCIVNPRNVRVFSVHTIVSGKRPIHVSPSEVRLNHYYALNGARTCDHSVYDSARDTGMERFAEGLHRPFLKHTLVNPGEARRSQRNPAATRRLIVTAANHAYFGSIVSLLGSIFRRYRGYERILVYDLGLSSMERLILSYVKDVSIRQVPPFCPHYLDVGSFAWKTAALCDALEEGMAVLWLDAGIEIQGSLDDLFETIERDGYLFTVTPLDQPNCRIGHLSHQRSLELLGADSAFFRNSLMVNAGVMGYLSGHPASELAYEAMQFAANPEITVGPRYSHRHDQTIYSVLRVKSGLPAQYNIFHLENVNAQFPFLIKAMGQEIVRDDVASGWSRTGLHIYLLVTRDRSPFDFGDSIEFAPHVSWARLLLRIGVETLHQAAVSRGSLGNLRDKALSLPLGRTIGARRGRQVGSTNVDKD